MKAIMIMFDTLRRKALPNYGNEWIKAPNFKRLQEKTVVFDNFYAGSLPCMPARRELHTGRYNFLHRSWGPLEPFDDSMPELLKNNGIYTHLVTDHSHYFEDGGATYHNRYNSWEGFRGQEGDRWKAHIGDIEIPEQVETVKSGVSFKQNWVNRIYQEVEDDLSAYKTFEAGMDFININKEEDNWFLQIECFDPHEPFYTPKKYKDLYPHEYDGKYFDWPSYQPVIEKKNEIDHVNYEYAALLSMCDAYLGKILDTMERYDMWKDTMLIVNTDHGLLMGEHDWWGKNVQPIYNEISHIPFFIWDPRLGVKNERRKALAQTIDIAPTLLEYFGVNIPKDMQGKPLKNTIKTDDKIREGALFGVHGGHVNVTDGKHLYMRASKEPENTPLYEYTLMPTVMRSFFSNKQLSMSELAHEFKFTKNMPVLKVPTSTYMSSFRFGNKLFNLENDENQKNNLADLELEKNMLHLLRRLMLEAEAPNEQYDRIGIFKDRNLSKEELVNEKKQRQINEELSMDFGMHLEEKIKKQLNFLKNIVLPKNPDEFLKRVKDICKEKELKHIDQKVVLEITDILLEQLNLGDKKQMVLNLIKYADKLD